MDGVNRSRDEVNKTYRSVVLRKSYERNCETLALSTEMNNPKVSWNTNGGRIIKGVLSTITQVRELVWIGELLLFPLQLIRWFFLIYLSPPSFGKVWLLCIYDSRSFCLIPQNLFDLLLVISLGLETMARNRHHLDIFLLIFWLPNYFCLCRPTLTSIQVRIIYITIFKYTHVCTKKVTI